MRSLFVPLVISILSLSFVSPSWAFEKIDGLPNLSCDADIAVAVCGPLKELNPYFSSLALEARDFYDRCLLQTPFAQLKSFTPPPKPWAMLYSKKGRDIYHRLVQNSLKSPSGAQILTIADMYDYDRAFLDTQFNSDVAKETITELLPLIEALEFKLIDSKAFIKFSTSLKNDLIQAIENQTGFDLEVKAIFRERIKNTQIFLPSQYLKKMIHNPDIVDQFRGYYDGCQLDGSSINAYNHLEKLEVVICPGTLLAGKLHQKIEKKSLLPSVILPSSRSSLPLPQDVKNSLTKIDDCGSPMDLMSIYTVLAHELGHSIDAGQFLDPGYLSSHTERVEQSFRLKNACLLKRYPPSQFENDEKKLHSIVGRLREVSADYWASEALSIRLSRTQFPTYEVGSKLRALKTNMRIFCVQSAQIDDPSLKESQKNGHLPGIHRVRAFFEQSPRLHEALGCTQKAERLRRSSCMEI